jgi:hypothetical protein
MLNTDSGIKWIYRDKLIELLQLAPASSTFCVNTVGNLLVYDNGKYYGHVDLTSECIELPEATDALGQTLVERKL